MILYFWLFFLSSIYTWLYRLQSASALSCIEYPWLFLFIFVNVSMFPCFCVNDLNGGMLSYAIDGAYGVVLDGVYFFEVLLYSTMEMMINERNL